MHKEGVYIRYGSFGESDPLTLSALSTPFYILKVLGGGIEHIRQLNATVFFGSVFHLSTSWNQNHRQHGSGLLLLPVLEAFYIPLIFFVLEVFQSVCAGM